MGTATILTTWAGEVDYDAALRCQEQLVAARQADQIDDMLLVLSHPPTYTAGRHADIAGDLTGLRPDIPVVRIDRGGGLTYHGPGQVVAYPIIRLPDAKVARRYVGALETALITTLAAFGIAADRREGYPGVWVGEEKVAAIGARITRFVTKHGVALNVDPDLADFGGIIPCGIADRGVTSMAALGVPATVPDVARTLTAALADALDRTPRAVPPSTLGLPAAPLHA